MRVISSDGRDIEAVEGNYREIKTRKNYWERVKILFIIIAESLVSYAGERFDFIVETNQNIDNFWIRFRGLMDCDERFTKAYQVAILRYEGASNKDPNGLVGYKYKSNYSTGGQVS